jgi:hypothetical protein
MGESIAVGLIFTLALVAFGIMYVINVERTLRKKSPKVSQKSTKVVKPAKVKAPEINIADLNEMTNEQLFEMGSKLDLPVYKSWSKVKLVTALAEHHQLH